MHVRAYSWIITCDTVAVGEYGIAVGVSRDKLSPDEQRKYDAAWQANAFNGYANDMMSLHRSLQDTRDAEYVNCIVLLVIYSLCHFIFHCLLSLSVFVN